MNAQLVTVTGSQAAANVQFEKLRKVILASSLLAVHGEVQREGPVIHLLVERAHDLSPLLGRLDGAREAPPQTEKVPVRSRDFQ